MQVKDLTIEHCQAIANLHVKSFDSFFLTSLGSQFLKVFYRAIINDSNGIAIGIDKAMAIAMAMAIILLLILVVYY